MTLGIHLPLTHVPRLLIQAVRAGFTGAGVDVPPPESSSLTMALERVSKFILGLIMAKEEIAMAMTVKTVAIRAPISIHCNGLLFVFEDFQ